MASNRRIGLAPEQNRMKAKSGFAKYKPGYLIPRTTSLSGATWEAPEHLDTLAYNLARAGEIRQPSISQHPAFRRLMSYADLGTSIYDAKFINEEQRDIAIYTAEQIGYARKETPLKDCTCSGFRQKVYSEEFPADPRYNEVLPAEFVESWKYMYPDWFRGFFSEKNMLPTRILLSMRKCQLCIASLEAASFHRVIGWDGKKVEIPVVTKEVDKVADQSMTDAENDAKFEKEFLEYISQDHAVYADETSEGPYIRHHSDEPDYETPESDDYIEESEDETRQSQEGSEESQHDSEESQHDSEESQHDSEESQHDSEDSKDSEDDSSDSSNNDPWDPDGTIPSIESDDTEDEDAKYGHEFPEEDEESDDEYGGDASDEEGSEDEEDYVTIIRNGGKKRGPAPSRYQPKAKKAKTTQSTVSKEGSPVSDNRISYGGKRAPAPGYGKYPLGSFSGKRVPENHQSISRKRVPTSVAGKYLPAPSSGKRVPNYENNQSVSRKSLPENHPSVSGKGLVPPLQRLPATQTRRAAPKKHQEAAPKTKKVKAAKPATTSKRNPAWGESEKVKLNALILARRELEKNNNRLPELYDTKLWNAMAPQLQPFTNNARTSSSCKNFWNREGRARFGDIDRKPAPAGVVRALVTSAQGQQAKAANKIKKAQKQKKGKKQQVREETEDEDEVEEEEEEEEQQFEDDGDYDMGDLYSAD